MNAEILDNSSQPNDNKQTYGGKLRTLAQTRNYDEVYQLKFNVHFKPHLIRQITYLCQMISPVKSRFLRPKINKLKKQQQ
jgi:hypothetical protein